VRQHVFFCNLWLIAPSLSSPAIWVHAYITSPLKYEYP
jgi:hypothetical protein